MVPTDHLAAARDLADVAERDAAACEEQRFLTPDVVAAVRESKLAASLAPRSVGGGERSVADLLAACAVIGRADASTAWVTAFYALHSWLAGLLPQPARDCLFEAGPAVFAPATFSPTGTAFPGDPRPGVPNHFTVSGRWQWATGVCHADWAMVAAWVRSERDAAPTDLRLFVVPIADAVVHDTWTAAGMRATGSHDLSLDSVVVPATHSTSFAALLDGSAAAGGAFDTSIGRWPLAAILALGAASPALGLAWGVLERYEARSLDRRLAYSGVRDAERGSTRARVARCRVELEAAELLLLETARRIDAALAADVPVTIEDRAHARMVASQTVSVARAVVAEVAAASGASAQLGGDPLQRAQRDLATLGAHVVFDHDATAELYGTVRLGFDPPLALL